MRSLVPDERPLLVVARPEPGLELTSEAAHSTRRDKRCMQAVDPDRGVDPGATNGGHDGARDITLFQRPDPGAGGADLRDDLLVPGAIEDHHGEVLNSSIAGERDAPEVVGNGIVQVDGPASARTGDHLLDVPQRRELRETARLHRDDDRHRVRRAPCYLA